MKKIISLYILFCIAFAACSTKRNRVSPDNTVSSMNISLPDTLRVSLPFRAFWKDFSQEYALSPDKYVPSEKLLQRYPVLEQNGNYIINGYLHVYPSFDKTSFQQLGGKSTQYNDSLLSFRIPIDKLPDMVKLKGIKYLEISTKARMNNH